MKKILMIIFILFIVFTAIFVYESIRNPVIKVSLPDNHNISTGSPLVFEGIVFGEVISVYSGYGSSDENTKKSIDTANIRLKGDIYDLIYKEDTFYVKDSKIYVERAKERLNPFNKTHIFKNTLYKSVYQNVMDSVDEMKDSLLDSFRSQSSRIFDNGIKSLGKIVDNQSTDEYLREKLNIISSRLKEYSYTGVSGLRARKEEILSYISREIGELKTMKAEEAVRTMEKLSREIKQLFDKSNHDQDNDKEISKLNEKGNDKT